jgi:hypothetical protein
MDDCGKLTFRVCRRTETAQRGVGLVTAERHWMYLDMGSSSSVAMPLFDAALFLGWGLLMRWKVHNAQR